jgi:hypothetical protein
MWASRTLARNSILGDGSSLVAQRLPTFLRQPSAFRADHAIRKLPWAPLASSRRVQTGRLSWTRASSSHGSLSKQWATMVRSEGRPCGKSSKRNAEYRITQSDLVGAASIRASAHADLALSGAPRIPGRRRSGDQHFAEWPPIGPTPLALARIAYSAAPSAFRIIPSSPIAGGAWLLGQEALDGVCSGLSGTRHYVSNPDLRVRNVSRLGRQFGRTRTG